MLETWLARAGDAALTLAALPLVAASAYLGAAALLSWRRVGRGRSPELAAAAEPPRITVVVPAHDEERGIQATLQSLFAVDYPRGAFRVLVVADNCRDRTAETAAAAGALVLVRQDPERRGKGHALRHAYDHVLARGDTDAVVIVDADSLVSRNLLRAVAHRLARGDEALQVHYAVRNPDASWRTRLLAVAFAAMHGERSLARERLGLSCGLRGNGMAFATRLLREVPHRAWSVVEDLEYGIALGLAGYRVAYVAEAEVCGEMAADEKASRTQRRRWEEGRRALADQHGWALLRRGIVERNPLLADLGLDLLVPPLATLAVWAGALLLAVLVGRTLGWPLPLAPWLLGAALVLLAAHVLRGWWLSGTGLLGLRDLLLVPWYVAWKLALRLAPRRPAEEWVRTPRAGED